MSSSETEPSEHILKDAEGKMKGALEVLQANLNSIRAGRATPEMLDPISVKVYDGKKMPIKELASISVPEPLMMTLKVWDSQNVKPIEKALRESNYHFNPQTDGTLVRIPLPQLTLDRRLELSKQAKKYTEDCKVALRNVRKKCNDDLKALQKEKKMSEDMVKQFMKHRVQKILDKMTVEAERKLDKKTKDIMPEPI